MLIDLSGVPEYGERQVIPAGSFVNVICTKAELKDNRSGRGQHILVNFKVTDGRFKGTIIWNHFNVSNESQLAVDLGLSQLKSFIMKAGMKSPVINSTSELVGLKVRVQLDVQEQENYRPKNVVISYLEVPPPSLDLKDNLPPYMDDKKDEGPPDFTTDDISF